MPADAIEADALRFFPHSLPDLCVSSGNLGLRPFSQVAYPSEGQASQA